MDSKLETQRVVYDKTHVGSAPFVLKTKLEPPTLKKNIIDRPDLLTAIRQNLHKKLILIIADAGYGKTTLLSQIIANNESAFVYYGLSKGDSDFETFFSYLVQGIKLIDTNLVQLSKRLLRYMNNIGQNYELAIGTLINELVEKRKDNLHILLDDYHTIAENSLVHRALDYFIEYLPKNVHVVVASRTPPPFSSLAKWRAKESIFDISRDKLRLSAREVKVLLNDVYKTDIPANELNRVWEKTEGWITGIQLILKTAGIGKKVKETLNGYVSASEPLFEYFAREVLSKEPEEIQDFLEKIAVLDIITPRICDTIFKMKDSRNILENLEKHHLFLSGIGKGKYKYHRLFQEFLLERFKDEGVKKSLHYRAAEYYRKNRELDLCIEHYLQAEKYELAGELIEILIDKSESEEGIGWLRPNRLKEYFSTIPVDVLERFPRLLIVQGSLCRDDGNHNRAEELYLEAIRISEKEDNAYAQAVGLSEYGLLLWRRGFHEQALKKLHKAIRICPPSKQKIKPNVLNLIGLVWQELGDLRKAKTYLLKAKHAAEQDLIMYNVVIIESNLATLLLQQGEPRRAFNSLAPLVTSLRGKYYIKIGVIFANAARAALDSGSIDWAEQCLEDGWTLCRPYEDRSSRASLHYCFGLSYMHKRVWDSALQHLKNAQKSFSKLGWARMEFNAIRTIGNLYRYKGDFKESMVHFSKARQYLEDRSGAKKSILNAFLLADQAFLEISLGKLTKALNSVKSCEELSKKFAWKTGIFLTMLARAEICIRKKKFTETTRLLKSVVRLAKLKGYSGILTQELMSNHELVEFLKKKDLHKAYIASLNIPDDKCKLKFKVVCFGGLRIEDNNERQIQLDWPTEKTRSLFAFLVTKRGVPLSREGIVENLWPDLPRQAGNKNFRSTASRIRKTLNLSLMKLVSRKDIFVYKHGRYVLLPNIDLDVDTERFCDLIKQAERAESSRDKAEFIHRALDLYTGDYLPFIYDSWADLPRQKFASMRLTSLRWFAEYTQRQGDDAVCVSACETYLSIEPFSEEVARLCMRSLMRLGRVGAVKACYESLRQALRRELHCTITKETKDLYNSLLNNRTKT